MFEIGDRVITSDGYLGTVEEIEDGIIAMRYLTPNNTPSICLSYREPSGLKAVGDNVVPMQKSQAWWDEANSLYAAIVEALR